MACQCIISRLAFLNTIGVKYDYVWEKITGQWTNKPPHDDSTKQLITGDLNSGRVHTSFLYMTNLKCLPTLSQLAILCLDNTAGKQQQQQLSNLSFKSSLKGGHKYFKTQAN